MLKVLILSVNDWANLGYTFSQCLKEIGIEAKSLTQYANPRYRDVAILANTKDMKREAIEADVIQFMHSKHINLGIKFDGKKVFVFHGGSKYRHNSNKLNEVFNPIINRAIIQTGDLFDLGAKDEVWLLPPVDTNNIIPCYDKYINDKLIIGHFPSSSLEKGSHIINGVMSKMIYLNKDILYLNDDLKVDWKENLKRISMCDIYIEQMRWGEWGITALEAAALGKIVITNFKSLDRYNKEYGNCELVVANNDVELYHAIKSLMSMNPIEIENKKRLTREWVETNHCYKAIGNRLNEIYIEG